MAAPPKMNFPILTLGLAGTACLILGYKFIIRPELNRRNYIKQEILAATIYQQQYGDNDKYPEMPAGKYVYNPSSNENE